MDGWDQLRLVAQCNQLSCPKVANATCFNTKQARIKLLKKCRHSGWAQCTIASNFTTTRNAVNLKRFFVKSRPKVVTRIEWPNSCAIHNNSLIARPNVGWCRSHPPHLQSGHCGSVRRATAFLPHCTWYDGPTRSSHRSRNQASELHYSSRRSSIVARASSRARRSSGVSRAPGIRSPDPISEKTSARLESVSFP